jgi:thiol:disulfide interchange protein DsbD
MRGSSQLGRGGATKLVFVLVCGLVCGLAGVTAAGAQSFSAVHAKVSLVSEDGAVAPGHVLWLGLLFDLEKGWHTYWQNPGDSGEAPKIQWELPKGFRAEAVRWPVPARLGSGTIIDYGYEGRVLLAVPVQVPADYAAGKPLSLSADVRYLACSDVCIPAKAHATLTIPSAAAGDAAAKTEFAEARGRWPEAMPAGWKVQAKDAGDHFVLSVETGEREAQASFFPITDAIDNAALPVVMPTARGADITLKKSDQLSQPVSSLKGVIVMGSGRGVEITAPVVPSH